MAGAGYKLFNTGDVLTAAQVNTYLQEQTVMVFADSAARTTALSGVLSEGMMSYLQDTNAVEVYNGTSWVNVGNAGDITEVQAGVGISIASGTGPIPVITNSSTDLITTAGDILYGTAADTMARLGIGTAGQVLKVNSGATAPEWGAAGGGKVLQVVSVKYTTEVTSNTDTLITSGLTLNITPALNTSKVLVLVDIMGGKYDTNTYINLQLRRGATNLADFGGLAAYTNSNAYSAFCNGINYLDSPATTSATTYEVFFASGANLSNAKINWTAGVASASSSMTLLEIGA